MRPSATLAAKLPTTKLPLGGRRGGGDESIGGRGGGMEEGSREDAARRALSQPAAAAAVNQDGMGPHALRASGQVGYSGEGVAAQAANSLDPAAPG